MRFEDIHSGLRAGLFLAAIAASSHTLAATADDVVCDKCVDASDIAGNAVTSAKIKKSAVTTGKIKNGAVTYGKLHSSIKAVVDAVNNLAVADFKDYSRPSSVGKKVFSLTGDFGTCGGAGNPDTEVRTFKVTDLGGGLSKEVQTRKRYVGGEGGTLCARFATSFVKTVDHSLYIGQKKYNASGTLQESYFTGFDPAGCDDCGIKLAHSNMVQGVEWASREEWTESKSATSSDVLLSKMVLLRAGFAETVQDGSPDEQTFSSCMETWEDRHSHAYWGLRTTMRVACNGIGVVDIRQVDTESGSARPRRWELKSYNVN